MWLLVERQRESVALLVRAFPPGCVRGLETTCREKEETIRNTGGGPWPVVSMADGGFWSQGARE